MLGKYKIYLRPIVYIAASLQETTWFLNFFLIGDTLYVHACHALGLRVSYIQYIHALLKTTATNYLSKQYAHVYYKKNYKVNFIFFVEVFVFVSHF